MNIVFFGTPEFAVPSLKALIEASFDIVGVVSTPDEPTGRNGRLTPPPIKVFAQENGLRILQPATLKDLPAQAGDIFFDEFRKLNPDICIIVAYGKIIPKRYLDVPKYGFVNIHPSLLPKYRGPSPIQSAILNGDTETGITLIKIDEEMDHGSIIASAKYQITNDKYYEDLEIEMAEIGAKLLIENLAKYLNGEIAPKKQEHERATYVKKFNREDGRIDWSKSAEQILNQIRALNPNPGVWTILNGKTLNIFKAEIIDYDSQEKVIKEKSRLLIRALDKYISPTLLQLEGKKVLPIKDFLNGLSDANVVIK